MLRAALVLTMLLAGSGARAWPVPAVTRAEASWMLIEWAATDKEQEAGTKPVVFYRIFRGENGGGMGVTATVFTASEMLPGDSRAFWDRGLTAGKVYTYVVQAVRLSATTVIADADACAASPALCLAQAFGTTLYSAAVSATAATGSVPGTSDLAQFGYVAATAGNGWATLAWVRSTTPYESNVESYRIYRATRPDGGAWTLNTVQGSDRFVDGSLENLRTYYYMFFPCCPARSPAFLRAMPYLPAAGTGIPEGRTDAAAGVRAVRLTWAPAIPGSFPVVAYAVFRSDDGGSTFAEVGRPSAALVTFVDSVPRYGQRYYYVIRPVDSAGNLGEAYRIVLIDVDLPTNRLFLNRNTVRPGNGQALDIAFQITEPGRVRINVFTLTGERVREIYDRHLPGLYTPDAPFNSLDAGLPAVDTRWNGANENGELVSSGAYLVVLEINDKRDVRTIAVIR